jgi:hypothetical protein
MEPPERGRPGPHPEPRPDLSQRPLPLLTVSGPWVRIYHCARGALHFGHSGDNRFDAPDRRLYGVLYVSDDAHGAFVETLGGTRGLASTLVVTTSALHSRCFSRVGASRELRVVDLRGPGLARIGADARLLTGDYRVAQRWSRALWEHPDQPDGIYYRARRDPDRFSLALFDRVRDVVQASLMGNLDAPENRDLLSRILDDYGGSLLDDMR